MQGTIQIIFIKQEKEYKFFFLPLVFVSAGNCSELYVQNSYVFGALQK